MNLLKQAFGWVEKNISQDLVLIAAAVLALLLVYFIIRRVVFGLGSIARGLKRMAKTLEGAGEQNIGNGYAVDEIGLPKALEQTWYVFFERLTKGEAVKIEDYFNDSVIRRKARFSSAFIIPIFMALVGPVLFFLSKFGITSVTYSTDSLWGIVALSASVAIFAVTLIVAVRADISRSAADVVMAAGKALPVIHPENIMDKAAGRMDLAADRIEAVLTKQLTAQTEQAKAAQSQTTEPIMADAIVDGFGRKINANINTQMTRIMDIMRQISEAQLSASQESEMIIKQLSALTAMQMELQEKLNDIQRAIENR